MSAIAYFDNAATTPLDPAVAEAMGPYLGECFGNPSSLHRAGREARAALEKARRQVAELIKADPDEILFTGGGTESDNLALIGAFEAAGDGPFHLIASAIEHPALLATCRYLEKRGAQVSYLGVDRYGMVDPMELRIALRPETKLVSVMAANNVVGTIQPLAELIRITKDHGALFHTDAVQAVGRLPFDLRNQAIDLLSFSSHKIYGPKGVGGLFVRKGVTLEPLLHGGGQESGRRSGTENIAGIVGFGAAAAIAARGMTEEIARLVQWREWISGGVKHRIPNSYLIGHPYQRLPGHIALGFDGQEGEAIKLLLSLDQYGFAVSSGSACSLSNDAGPSHVLQAMGFDPLKARGGLRITLGRFNTTEEVERLLEVLPRAVAELRPIASRL